jgi:hypothetical protein
MSTPANFNGARLVIDASGTYSKMAQEITLAHVMQAGVVPMDTAAVASVPGFPAVNRKLRQSTGSS